MKKILLILVFIGIRVCYGQIPKLEEINSPHDSVKINIGDKWKCVDVAEELIILENEKGERICLSASCVLPYPQPVTHNRPSVTHSLSGRSVVGGFPLPAYNSQNQGTVVVEVTVNQEGKVTKARAIGKGSTIQDAKLSRAAEEAALKARFNVKKDAPISQIGTITYHFSSNI